MSDISKHLGDERRLKLSIDKIKEVISKSTPVVNWYAHTEDKTVRGPFGRWFTASGEDKHLANINNDVEYCAMAMTILPEMVEEIQHLKQQLDDLQSSFNDRVKVIELQNEDKKHLKQQLEEKECKICGASDADIIKHNEELHKLLKDAVEVIHWYAMPSINHHAYHDVMGTNLNIKAEQFLAKYRREK